ncbi:MAG: aminotransferase [Comamonadaceae bacterium]|nr:MAG: aminotransferase [Comamonadaceae bacterium]
MAGPYGSPLVPLWTDTVHGGADALGVALHDFSTNSNACGPCPVAVATLQAADATHYPDPGYTALRALLGAFHGVEPARIVIAGSASEFIHRITALAARKGACAVAVPAHAYGDYARAALAWGLAVVGHGECHAAPAPGLQWACEPSSPLGHADAALPLWGSAAPLGTLRVLDCAYVPLRLEGGAPAASPTASTWQLWSPNKALGLTGVRAAYAIAPVDAAPDDLAALRALAPSWPVGAHGVALLQAWAAPAAQHWLAACVPLLRDWKAQQSALCAALGWQIVAGGLANYFVARIPAAIDLPTALQALRGHCIKLRDCASFGLPGHVRLGVLAPAAQLALARAWPACVPETTG